MVFMMKYPEDKKSRGALSEACILLNEQILTECSHQHIDPSVLWVNALEKSTFSFGFNQHTLNFFISSVPRNVGNYD